VLVQRTALSILTRHWTDNILKIFSDYEIGPFVFVANVKYLHISMYFYDAPITMQAPLPPLESPAQIIESVITPRLA